MVEEENQFPQVALWALQKYSSAFGIIYILPAKSKQIPSKNKKKNLGGKAKNVEVREEGKYSLP